MDRNKDWAWRRDTGDLSPSSRRAWIEIPNEKTRWQSATVALLAEGVDRNGLCAALPVHERVALLAEGVDRNVTAFSLRSRCGWSPSSRRAWIEINYLGRSEVL